ncbi:MAG: GGDEF domain-containing protein [Clostridiales Family XIII bacterium]|nr:GGDEF domain-containing protein [Clostridiales Family XIII bacterium]
MPEPIASKDDFRRFLDSLSVYTYVVDDGTDELLMVGDYYARNLGVDRARMEGRPCWEFSTADGRCPFCPRTAAGPDGEGAGPRTVEAFHPTLGIWGKWSGQEIVWDDGRPARLMTFVDISSEMLLRDELTRLAYYDSRMNIPNRAKIERDLAARQDNDYCLIAFDYDSLRYINDAYGRALVDGLLETVVAWIRSFDLHNYEIYRVDSDEFVLLFDDADMMSACGLADRLQERFREPWEVPVPGGGTTTLSCNIAICVVDGRLGLGSPADILSITDRTLDIAKETGAVAVYDQDMDEVIKRDLAMEVSLKDCVQDGMKGFEVYFQPIIDPAREMWVGVEALCRWDSPAFGRVPPLVFIRIAEQIGVINKLGNWVLDTAIGICADLRLHEIPGFILDVNLSPSQMADETLIESLLLSLQRHGFPPSGLSLEIAESEQFTDGGYPHTTVERLKSLEVKLALEDFGTGYSNFNNLRNLPVSILKTEKQFIDNIAYDGYQQFLLKILVEIARAADMSLIAEGVETPEQMVELLRTGADYFQGYLFAKPLTAAELADNVHRFTEQDAFLHAVKEQLSHGQ